MFREIKELSRDSYFLLKNPNNITYHTIVLKNISQKYPHVKNRRNLLPKQINYTQFKLYIYIY